MTLFLDGMWFLAFLTTLFGTWALRGPTGPEGPVGAWLAGVFPCLFTGIILFTMASRSMLDFIPGGRLVQFIAAAAILVTLCVGLIGSVGQRDWTSQALSVLPYVILLGCIVAAHRTSLPESAGLWASRALLGSTALMGLAVIAVISVISIRDSIRASALRAEQEQAREKQYEAEEVAAYRALPADVPLHVLLRSTWSRNETVKAESRARVDKWPDLDDQLNTLLEVGNQDVIQYVAFVYEKPPARLAKGWAVMLAAQRQAWDVLQHDEYAGKWEPNLSSYFEGAQKIQKAGGDLRPQLRSWHELLSKSKGLGNLAAFVKTLL